MPSTFTKAVVGASFFANALALPQRLMEMGGNVVVDASPSVDIVDVYETIVVTVTPGAYTTPPVSATPSTRAANIYSSSAVTTSTRSSSAFYTPSTALSSVRPSASASPSANSSTNSTSPMPSVLRGVNLGGWLVLEKWMTPDVFSGAFSGAVDQWTFDSIAGAQAALQTHWDSYITEDDIAKIASWGINAVRIPIGYWAYKKDVSCPYISGADAYLEKAIQWCRSHNVKVLIDLHGAPGSQNGFDNSGRSGDAGWQQGGNLDATIDALRQITQKYATPTYADTVFGIELVNEPISWGNNKFEATQSWAKDAFNAVKSASRNPDLNIIMHDGFMGASSWTSVAAELNAGSSLATSKFWIDEHLYQNMVAADSTLTQQQHIQKACDWSSSQFLPASSTLPVIAGEFSAQTNICANPDSTTVAGSVCNIDGCQCSSNVDIQYWKAPLVQATRMYLEAEMDTFEAHGRGWFIWSYKGPGAWGLDNIMQYGVLGKTVTERKYPHQCA